MLHANTQLQSNLYISNSTEPRYKSRPIQGFEIRGEKTTLKQVVRTSKLLCHFHTILEIGFQQNKVQM